MTSTLLESLFLFLKGIWWVEEDLDIRPVRVYWQEDPISENDLWNVKTEDQLSLRVLRTVCPLAALPAPGHWHHSLPQSLASHSHPDICVDNMVRQGLVWLTWSDIHPDISVGAPTACTVRKCTLSLGGPCQPASHSYSHTQLHQSRGNEDWRVEWKGYKIASHFKLIRALRASNGVILILNFSEMSHHLTHNKSLDSIWSNFTNVFRKIKIKEKDIGGFSQLPVHKEYCKFGCGHDLTFDNQDVCKVRPCLVSK